MTREQRAALLRPLVDRCHLGHCWVKTKNGPRRIDEPFTEVKLSEHVTGGNAYGLCPIAPGESVTRAAVLDFDSHKGETPWADMLETARHVATVLELEGYAPILFRSSGGAGVHLFLVWGDPQDAYSVREMLRGVLAQCGFTSGTGGVARGEVEIFPKQDSVPADGFGSMFVLPLSGKSEHLGGELWAFSPSVPVLTPPPKPERAVSAAPEVQHLRSALATIPNDTDPLDYDAWRNIVFAIHYATGGSDEGLALAHEFSARAPGKYDPDFLDNRVWPYISTERGGEVITDRTLFAMAESHGWIDPALIDSFPVVDTTAQAVAAGRFAVIPEHEFLHTAAPGWIVKNVLPRAGLAVVYGDSGSGKTFFVFDMLAAVARGEAWRGLKTKQGRGVYIAAEGAGYFRNRIKAYKRQHQVERLDIGVIPDAPNFMKTDDIKTLAAQIEAFGPVAIIVVDTFAQVMPGANENSGEDVGKAIAHCRHLHTATGALVVLVHHSGKDAAKGARGWSGLRAAADAEIEVSRFEDDRVATITKLKDGQDGNAFGFRLAQIPVDVDEDGEVVSSCVVEAAEVSRAAASGRRKPLGEVEKAVLTTVEDLVGVGGGRVPDSRVLGEAIERLPAPQNGARDTRKQRVDRALRTLRVDEKIVWEGGEVGLA